ncbi:MAG: hypothetical protein KA777_13270 [Rhodoferax sp.]|nr:hypothetical protein [Rhodoferax sp.]
MSLAAEIVNFTANFRNIYFRGIPLLLNDDGAYLAFGCSFSGVEALSGYRYVHEKSNGTRFRNFVVEYFDPRYHPLTEQFWELRNSVIHGFSPKHFVLCHGQPAAHFNDQPPYAKILNADSLFLDFKAAAERYLVALGVDSALQASFEKHLLSTKGGSLYVE